MTNAASREIELVVSLMQPAETQQDALVAARPELAALEMSAQFLNTDETPETGTGRWYDFIGPQVEAELHEPVRELMTIALAHDVGSRVMLRFAELIRAGHDVGSAVEEIGSALRV